MPAKDSVETLIEREFDGLSPELQRAARWVRSNGPVLALRSMRSAAGQAGVSPATMTRLARRWASTASARCANPMSTGSAGGALPALPFVRRARALQRGAAATRSPSSARCRPPTWPRCSSATRRGDRTRGRSAAARPARALSRPARVPRRGVPVALCLRAAVQQRRVDHRSRRHAGRPGGADRARPRAAGDQPVAVHARHRRVGAPVRAPRRGRDRTHRQRAVADRARSRTQPAVRHRVELVLPQHDGRTGAG